MLLRADDVLILCAPANNGSTWLGRIVEAFSDGEPETSLNAGRYWRIKD